MFLDYLNQSSIEHSWSPVSHLSVFLYVFVLHTYSDAESEFLWSGQTGSHNSVAYHNKRELQKGLSFIFNAQIEDSIYSYLIRQNIELNFVLL